MMRLKHYDIHFELHAIAPIICREKINSLRLKFDAQPSALHVFAELNSVTVDRCQYASVTRKGILFELFWMFQSAKSWDLKRSSPTHEMFNLVFNGALIQQSDCVHLNQMASIVTEKMSDAQPKKRLAYSEDIFIQATACVSCNWDDTYKHRGNMLPNAFIHWGQCGLRNL